MAFGDQRRQLGVADLNQGKLGCDEKAVDEHQDQDPQHLEPDADDALRIHGLARQRFRPVWSWVHWLFWFQIQAPSSCLAI